MKLVLVFTVSAIAKALVDAGPSLEGFHLEAKIEPIRSRCETQPDDGQCQTFLLP